MIYTDFGGVPRGKRLRQHEVLAVYESGRMFPGSITVVDITGQDTVETGLVWEDGDADRSMKPIPGTLVRTPWGGDTAAQFLVDFYELDGTPHDLDPRHVLGRVIDRFTADGKAIRQTAGQCLKRVPLERPLRLIGVRVGALVRVDSAEATTPATRASRSRTPPDAAAQTASLF